jgi:hypothetical protein
MAVSRGAVSAVELVTLTDAKGARLPLDKGDHQVVVLSAAPCCGHGATRAVEPQRLTMFETSEHILIPYGLSLRFETGVQPAHAAQLTLTPNFHLTYGQIIALGGDFYADPDQPVCDLPNPAQRVDKFNQNFATLVNSGQEVANILRVAKKFEFDPIAAAIKNRQSPSGVYVHNASQGWGLLSDSDRAYDGATGGVDGGKSGRYLNIAFSNFDHFGTDAVTCYLAGHVLAQQTAITASKTPPGDERKVLLQRAYAINAFADHFLTDLFAAGHMRTPRRALFQIAWTYPTQVFSGLLAQRMHDEDNKFGLWVENRVGDRWVAYGDKRFRDRVNAGNRKVVKKAVQCSMDEVWGAFSTGSIRSDDSDVLKYIANLVWEIVNEPTASRHRDDRRNWAPLFWRNPGDGNVWRRNDLFNPGDRSFGEYSAINPFKWGLSTTVAQIKAAGTAPLMPDAEYTRAGYPPRPDEAGPSGEVGWPAGPTAVVGWSRPMTGITGPDLRDMQPSDWVVDGAPGPTN